MIDKVFDHFPYFSKVQILPHEAKSERLKIGRKYHSLAFRAV